MVGLDISRRQGMVIMFIILNTGVEGKESHPQRMKVGGKLKLTPSPSIFESMDRG